jgi:hypothetical protein
MVSGLNSLATEGPHRRIVYNRFFSFPVSVVGPWLIGL